MNKLTVIDFFCGAGGFSEGFRQMGFEIIQGYDIWKPAIDTFNLNFGTNSSQKNILDFYNIEEIEILPDTDIIVGSPPCVSFSSSNKSGKADKSMGVKLTEAFLRIIAVKKHQPNSKLKAWFMENVSNSKKYLQEVYTFKDLDLEEWAIINSIDPNKIAISYKNNSVVLNSADYGSYQARRRLITGEIINKDKLIIPKATHQSSKEKKDNLPLYNTVRKMKEAIPNPFSKIKNIKIKDPQFDIEIDFEELTDHFYDTGIYAVDAKFSRHWKVNHPYMGRMSFPENENNPSRTITATRIANSRESIVYKSEIDRKGDGEYRLPTIREAAILMGFPITFQFTGSEYTKWRLIGNAVCSSISKNLAKTVLESLSLEVPEKLTLINTVDLDSIENLNTFKQRIFNNPPIKNKGAKCRWHTFKDGNMTVTLSNFRIKKDRKAGNKWITSIQYGTGQGYPSQIHDDGMYKNIEDEILKFKNGEKFIKTLQNGFSKKIGSAKELQKLFEKQESSTSLIEPTELVDSIGHLINKLHIGNELIKPNDKNLFKHKDEIPLNQLFMLYGINKIVSTANNK